MCVFPAEHRTREEMIGGVSVCGPGGVQRRMAPYHHHLELGGMSEPQIVRLFTAVSVGVAAAAVALAWRFGCLLA